MEEERLLLQIYIYYTVIVLKHGSSLFTKHGEIFVYVLDQDEDLIGTKFTDTAGPSQLSLVGKQDSASGRDKTGLKRPLTFGERLEMGHETLYVLGWIGVNEAEL